jgi:alkanesulfonate monooxygenase SsuD/methylene tetrahydromethanopterin reductase-like flavin-dependent oxidoreductase (luciferase family)
VAPTEAEARALGAGFEEWVHSIRSGKGAIPDPSPEDAAALPQAGPVEADLVRDRLDTRFVGNPAQVAAGLRTLQRVTGADELLVTTIAHSQAHRVRSQELLADKWGLG